MAMMILRCISGTSRIGGLNGIRMLMLLLISEAHRMASNGSWIYVLQPRDLKRDWLLFNSSSNSQGKAQLGGAWSDTYPYKGQLCWGNESGKGLWSVHVLPTWWGSWSRCASWIVSEEGRRVAARILYKGLVICYAFRIKAGFEIPTSSFTTPHPRPVSAFLLI